MSDLHLSLIGFGLLVIVGVVAYNWIQEQKFRKIAQQRFQTPREDVLMTHAESRGPATIARETLNDVRIEPRLSAAQAPEQAQAIVEEETIAGAPAAPRTPTAPPHKPANELPAPIDAAIDYVVRLDFAEAVQAEAVRVALGDANFGKPVLWRALNATGQWEDLRTARDRLEFTTLIGALQLADRAGAVASEDLNRFTQQVQQVAEMLMAVAQFPERQGALENAAKLDQFCADVDILVGVNVVALEQDSFTGTKIRALAEAGGFKFASDGTFQYLDDHGVALYTLSNQESAPFNSDEMKHLSTHGLTLLFDVPRIPNGLRAFDQMVLFARQLTDSLRGLMVDDNLRPLTDDGIAKIKQQLSLIYGKMDKNGITAGSARAQRLFS
jgi:FtsZ-interacting cell division protein ZipA